MASAPTTSQLMTNTNVSAAVSTDSTDLSDHQCCAIRADWTTVPSSAKTWHSQAKALLVVQDLTFTSATFGTAGNSTTIAYTGGATAGAEVVTVTGPAISIQIQSGTSTATQIRTAFNLVAAATALAACSVSGTGSNTQTTASVTPLAGGLDSQMDLTGDKVTITAHGYLEGTVGQLTTTGTLPTGLSLSTNYFVIVVDANTLKFASTRAHADSGTQVDITAEASGTHTFTPTTTVSATMAMQGSVDGTNWETIDAAKTQTLSATGSYMWKESGCGYRFAKLLIGYTSGQVTVNAVAYSK